jgi:site-specific recombinase XerC
LTSVAYSHSQSKATEEQYKRVWERFTRFFNTTAKEILADYEAVGYDKFKRKYAQMIRAWIAELSNNGLTNTSIKVMVGAIKSFFRYNDLPLGMVPQAMNGIVYHNRDITKDEIAQVMTVSKIREKAFFAVMTQSGLRPHTIVQLKMKHLEPLDKAPCKIEVPQEIAKGKYGSYVTFIGADAIKYLKQYLATRTNLAPENLLFCAHDNPHNPVNVKDMSRAFRLSLRKLEESGALKYEIREGKPSELRLYNLRKFFRKFAIQMGFEIVEYMMGHIVKGVDGNYRPQDPEYYRTLYAEKAMPFLRLEEPTPTETGEIINTLKKQHGEEMGALKEQLKKRDEQIQALNERFNKYERYLKLLEDRFKPNPTEEQVQITEKLLPDVEDLLYKNPEKVAEMFLNNNDFRKLFLSKIPHEELAEVEKIAKEQNTTTNEILKQKLVETLNDMRKGRNAR